MNTISIRTSTGTALPSTGMPSTWRERLTDTFDVRRNDAGAADCTGHNSISVPAGAVYGAPAMKAGRAAKQASPPRGEPR